MRSRQCAISQIGERHPRRADSPRSISLPLKEREAHISGFDSTFLLTISAVALDDTRSKATKLVELRTALYLRPCHCCGTAHRTFVCFPR